MPRGQVEEHLFLTHTLDVDIRTGGQELSLRFECRLSELGGNITRSIKTKKNPMDFSAKRGRRASSLS